MKYKKTVFLFVLTAIFVSLSFFGVLFYYDPLKIFHKPWKYKAYLQQNMRSQAAGIINNWEYDSLILGTSMLENTSAKEASFSLGGNFINISLSGSDFYERYIVLQYALHKKSLKKVIYSLDDEGLVDGRKSDPSYKIEKWNYLYDNNPFNDFKVYLSRGFLKCLFSTSSKKKCMGRKLNFDRPNAWYWARKDKYGGLDNWFKQKLTPRIINHFKPILTMIKHIEKGEFKNDSNVEEDINNLKHYLDKHIVFLVRKYPGTEFLCILPPYSRAKYALDFQYNKPKFKKYIESLRYMVQMSDTYKNLKIYGWGNEDFLNDMANYKDLKHYEYKYNSWMLKAMKEKKGLLKMEMLDTYISKFQHEAAEYNLTTLGNKLENYLAESK